MPVALRRQITPPYLQYRSGPSDAGMGYAADGAQSSNRRTRLRGPPRSVKPPETGKARTRGRLVRRLVLLAVLFCVLLVGCSDAADDEYSTSDTPDSQTASITVPDLSVVARAGAELFTANWSECHGPTAGGSSQGPPLIDSIYEPGHHADFSFYIGPWG